MDADDPPRDKEERLHTLFQPFHRGRNINETPGTGLGLRVVDAASTRATDRPTDRRRASCDYDAILLFTHTVRLLRRRTLWFGRLSLYERALAGGFVGLFRCAMPCS